MRARLRLSSPAWLAQPRMTSSSVGPVDAGVALDQRADRDRGEVVGADARQRAAVAADRGADGVADEGFGHVRHALRSTPPRRHLITPDLVELDAFEQRLEIALAEAFVALALDDLEEDRADHVLGEDLQQQALALGRRAVDQDAALLELGGRLAMAFDALVDQLVISVGRVLERNAAARAGCRPSA